jgi:polyhydroxybutyrate depolymerase
MRSRAARIDRLFRRAAWAAARQARRAFLALTLTPVAGCADRVTTQTFVEPSTQRAYKVVTRVDHSATSPASVLFVLHAYATSPEVLPAAFGLDQHAVEQRGMLLVVPEGRKDDGGRPFWNASAGCCGDARSLPDDVGYLRAVLADVSKHFAVDRARIFALGVSNGAFMAQRWACTPGGDLRGIVAVSGMAPGPADPPCAPSVPVRVLHVHGDADSVIRYAGGAGIRGPYPSAADSARRWRELNHCEPHPSEERRWSLLHGATRKLSAHGPDADVVLWTFEGGDHQLRSLRFAVDELLGFFDPVKHAGP